MSRDLKDEHALYQHEGDPDPMCPVCQGNEDEEYLEIKRYYGSPEAVFDMIDDIEQAIEETKRDLRSSM